MKRFKHQSVVSLSLAILFTFLQFVSAYGDRRINICDLEILIKVTDDATPFDSCENFVDRVVEQFSRAASNLYSVSESRSAITKFIVDVPSSWKFSCNNIKPINECRRHHVLLTNQDTPFESFIHRNFPCDKYGKYSSIVTRYQELERYDLYGQVWRAFEYRHYHEAKNDVDVCEFRGMGPHKMLAGQKECSPESTPVFQFYSYQYNNELSMTLDIKTEIDGNVFKLTLKPKLNGYLSNKIDVSATIKLGTKRGTIDAKNLGNGNYGMTITDPFGPGTYRVTFHVQGTDTRWYPDETDRHCDSNYKDPVFVRVGTFNWEYPSTEEYTFTSGNQPALKTRRPVIVELTTLGYEEPPELPDILPTDVIPGEKPTGTIDGKLPEIPDEKLTGTKPTGTIDGKLPDEKPTGTKPTGTIDGKLPDEKPTGTKPTGTTDGKLPEIPSETTTGTIPGKLPTAGTPGFGNQPSSKTRRPRVKSTTPRPTDQEPSNDLTVLYIVAPIVVLAVVSILFYIFYGKDKLKKKKGHDEDSEEDGGTENEDEDDNDV